MTDVNPASFPLSSEESAVLAELLDSERTRLLVEIRHTDHRSYRDELRKRLDIVERLLARLQQAIDPAA